MSTQIEFNFICFCGCCFVERRDYGLFGVGYGVYVRGVSLGEMAMQAGAVRTVLEKCCQGAGK